MLVAGESASVRITKPDHDDIVYDVVIVSDDGNHVVLTAPWVEPEARDVGFATWLSADRAAVLRLDEDEFAASGIEERDPEAAAHARDAFEYLAGLSSDGWDALLVG